MTSREKIPFYSLEKMHLDVRKGMNKMFLSVLENNWFVLGRQLEKFEIEFASNNGVKYAAGVGNGMDALKISLLSLELKRSSKVLIPALTFSACILAVLECGLTPVLADVDEKDCLLNPESLLGDACRDISVVMPVHLYGYPCDMISLVRIARENDLYLIEDFAQAAGARISGIPVGSLGLVNATSFYPVKPLGALGDGGMITTNDPLIYKKCRQLRNYGYSDKYTMEIQGVNSRLDEMQAAFLRVKMNKLETWRLEREKIAERYTGNFSGLEQIRLQWHEKERIPAFHIFPIRIKNRDGLKNHLAEKGIQTQIHYPIPPHRQRAFSHLGYKKGSFPVTEEISETELSLPIYPGLRPEQVDRISSYIRDFVSR